MIRNAPERSGHSERTLCLCLSGTEHAQCVSLQPLGGGRDVLKERPQLQRWRSRVQSAVGEAFDEAHSVLYALRDRRRARL